jgi:LytR cell envelope-related transcriptional attenuator
VEQRLVRQQVDFHRPLLRVVDVTLLLALLLAAELPLPRATLLGWTADGRTVALDAVADSVEKHGRARVGEARFLVLADSAGAVQKVLREERVVLVSDMPAFTLPVPMEQLWAKSADAGDWKNRNGLTLIGEPQGSVSEPLRLTHRGVAYDVRVESAKGSGCRTARLVAALGGVSASLAEDRCAAGDKAELQNDLETAWSPDGRSVALLWNVLRDGARRSHLAVASARALASVDLLDAGGGAQAQQKVSESLAQAGFRVAHKGKALAQRTATVIYFATGFEAEAREAARLLGGSAQPLAFKSPYALTVALAREQ